MSYVPQVGDLVRHVDPGEVQPYMWAVEITEVRPGVGVTGWCVGSRKAPVSWGADVFHRLTCVTRDESTGAYVPFVATLPTALRDALPWIRSTRPGLWVNVSPGGYIESAETFARVQEMANEYRIACLSPDGKAWLCRGEWIVSEVEVKR